ncbi:hypothetical protein ABZ840_37425 [Streptomyces sp. NPDC047117]|uniref:hypothetical protein n=1 Tax=Streptomyces sp. NPDC047117 TaxID=3155379 RepID=UPI0033C30270
MRPAACATCNWTYDGTHLYGSDSETVPAERTYWTDDQGILTTKKRAGVGQTWTVAPWKPTPTGKADGTALVLTGLLGPLAGIFGG